MNKIDFKKEILPHLIVVIGLVLISLAFFAPTVFQGKVLGQHDITQWRGGANEIIEYREATGEEALWTNAMFSGMPSYLVGTTFSGDLTSHLQNIYTLYLPHPSRLIFMAFLSCYIMLIVFGVRPWLSAVGAIAFGLSGFLIISIGAGHNSKVAAVALMPLVMAGVHLAFSKKRLLGFALTALAMALELRVNHLQITYYLFLIIVIYGASQLYYSYKDGLLKEFSKTVAVLVVAVVIGVGANAGRLWTIMEYSPYSIRGKSELVQNTESKGGLDKDYAFQYSNGIFEPLVLFIPNFFGGSSQQDLGKNSNLEKALQNQGLNRQQIKQQVQKAPAYWGDQPLTAPYYAGAIVVFAFVLGLFLLEKKHTYWAIIVVVLSIALSWGSSFSSFNYFMFDYLPGYNKFRSVTFAIIMAVFSMSIIGFMGLEKLIQSEWSAVTKKKLMLSFGVVGGFALLAVILAGVGSYQGAIDVRLAEYPDWFLTALRADRQSLLRFDALRSLMMVSAFVAALWFYKSQKLSSTLTYSICVLIVVVDMFFVGKRFINEDNYVSKSKSDEFVASDADKRIMNDTGHYRVLNLINPFNDAKTSYHHSSIGGYHGAKMRRYQDLIEFRISPEINTVIKGLQSGQPYNGSGHVINMLNTKYMVAGETANAVFENPHANGNAWFVNEIKWVNNPDEELAELGSIDTKSTVVVDKSKFELTGVSMDSTAMIVLEEYSPNYLKYKSKSEKSGVAVFSEVYYPEGWSAKIDGEPVQIARGNYVLRCLTVPAGEHSIEFVFEPQSYQVGNVLSLIFNVLTIVCFVGAVGYSIRNKA